MRSQRFCAHNLVALLKRQTIATMQELKVALGSSVDMTVFRKLRQIDYCTSYSHAGGFYALREVVRFDARGLWSWGDVGFSQFGSLLDTAEHFVLSSDDGRLVSELATELGVEVKGALLHLVRIGRLEREVVSGLYVYCSPERSKRGQQLLTRSIPPARHPYAPMWDPTAVLADETRAAIILFLSTLNEKQRRLYAGLESLRFGTGGDRRIAEVTGMDVHTISKGRRELLQGKLDHAGIRRPGAGRPPFEKKPPT